MQCYPWQKRKEEAFIQEIANGHTHCVGLWLNEEIDLNAEINGQTALVAAVEAVQPRAMQRLLAQKGIDIDKKVNGLTALQHAVRCEGKSYGGYSRDKELSQCVALLLKAGANVLVQDTFGRTSLHLVVELWFHLFPCRRANVLIKDFLIHGKAGFCLSVRDNFGNLPISKKRYEHDLEFTRMIDSVIHETWKEVLNFVPIKDVFNIIVKYVFSF